MNYNAMKVVELRAIAIDRGIMGIPTCAVLKKVELVDLLTENDTSRKVAATPTDAVHPGWSSHHLFFLFA
jgi:hypothetical protein